MPMATERGDQLIRGVAAGLACWCRRARRSPASAATNLLLLCQTTRIDEQAVELVEAMLAIFLPNPVDRRPCGDRRRQYRHRILAAAA